MSKSYYENVGSTSQTLGLNEYQNRKSQYFSRKESENICYSDRASLNKLLREKENSLVETNQKLIAKLAFLETMSNKKDEKIKILLEENSHLKGATESFEELKMRINIYERIDFPSILRNSGNESEIKTEILSKIKGVEADFGKEIIRLNNRIEEFKLQIFNMTNGNNNNSQLNKSEEINSINDLITNKDSEIMELKIKLAKAEITIDIKTNQIKRFEDELEQQRNQINKLINDNNFFNSNNLTPQLSSNSVENTLFNLNNNNEGLNKELINKLAEVEKIRDTLKEELEIEKNKYLSLLEMNQDLGKKVIENMKIMNENKSEILYLKKKVAEMQKERGDYSTLNNDSTDSLIFTSSSNNVNNNNNFDVNFVPQEDWKKAIEARLQLEKANTEQKMQILELTEQLNLLGQKTQTLSEELKLEKLENENLKEIQKSDLKNISKILSEHGSQQQLKKHEEFISELKISLQNTNKINQELANQKSNLEKEVYELRSKLREQNTSLMLMTNYKDSGIQNQNIMKDDKSIAALSKYSLASNMTSSKFFDSKIKDLEESLVQEKENAENLLRVKQRVIEKLKKSNENLLAEKNKLMRELAEERMKSNSLLMEKNSLLESEEYFKAQIHELNAEICDLKLYQENYELIEEKLEEFQKQFANLVSVNDNPGLQNEQYQKLVNENVDLNAYKTKYFQIECEMQEKNKDILMLKDRLFYLEREASMRNNIQNSTQPQQVSNDININNINFNSIHNGSNNNSEKCGNCALLEGNFNKIKQILDEYNKKIKEYQVEINELKITIEDNKLVIFSLREKCKDIISKDKEILRLNTIITDLNNRKKKKVSFGRETIVEFKKENSPSEQVIEMEVRETQDRQKENTAAFKLSELLKSQEHLFDKYQKEFESLKKFRTPNLSIDSIDLKNSESIEAGVETSNRNVNGKSSGIHYSQTNSSDNNNYFNDYSNNYNNQISLYNDDSNNNAYYTSYKSETPSGVYYSRNNTEPYNSYPNYERNIDSNLNDKNFLMNEKEINFDNSRKQGVSRQEEQKENTESVLSSGKIDIDAYKNLSTNLETEFDRIKSKYNIGGGENRNSYQDFRNSNSTFRSFCEKLDLASMSKSEIFDKNDFETVKDSDIINEYR